MALEIGYCIECNELNYAATNANGVFERANMSFNHEGHKQIVFGEPKNYPAPIRNVLCKLNAGLPISNNEIICFKLSMQLDMEDLYEQSK